MKSMFSIFAMAFVSVFLGCSQENATDIMGSVTSFNGSVEGVSQKGPLLMGASVTIQELDGRTLLQTGKNYKGKVVNDYGSFVVENVSLESPYVLLEVNGYYRNEVTGANSKSSVFLMAFADLSGQSQVNVNLLTHLEYERIRNLVEKRKKTFAEAKLQADREVFAAFYDDIDHEYAERLDIFGNSDADAALLAINVLLLGRESEASFLGRLTNIVDDFTNDGTWDDYALKAKIADVACEMSLSGNNELSKIRQNMESWKIAEIPAFEPYVEYFWAKQYGLGKCDASKDGLRVKNSNSSSVYAGLEFTCSKEYGWTANINGYLIGCDTCNTIRDLRDNQVYRVMNVGGANWMASDLRYDNGNECYQCFNDDCDAYDYGYRYSNYDYYKCNYSTYCPDGWRLPTTDEFNHLLQSATEEELRQFFSVMGWNVGDFVIYRGDLWDYKIYREDFSGYVKTWQFHDPTAEEINARRFVRCIENK